MAVRSAFELVGREAEMRQIDEFIASIRTGAGALVLCGEPGVGKTALWRLACERATAAGTRVLAARCTEAEMPMAFASLADLIADAATEVGDELPGQQREALAAAFGYGEASRPPPDWLVLARAVLATLQGLARRAPVLVAVDDVRWLDPGSRRVATYAFRRMAALPVGLITTARDSQSTDDTLRLAEVVPPERVLALQVGGLGPGAVQYLLATRLGVHVPRPTAARVHSFAGGNPMFALELARAASDGDGRILGRVAPMSVPPSLEQLVRARISQVRGPLLELLEIVALLERPTLPELGNALGDGATAADLVAEAVQADALVVGEDGRIRFAHPLVGSGVYFGIGPGRRRTLHRHLADVAEDVAAQARHIALAATGPDRGSADLLDRAAASVASHGALDAAAELVAEAARLTPDSDMMSRWRRLLACAGWLLETGEFAVARTRLDSLLAGHVPAAVRTEALLLRAECEFADRHVLIDLLHEALAVADEPRSRWHVVIRLAHHGGWVSGDVQMASRTAHQALDIARDLADQRLAEDSLAALAFYEAAGGRPFVVAPLAEWEQHDEQPRMQWWKISPAISHGCRLMWAGDLAGARRVLAREYESLRRLGRETRVGFTMCWLSELEWRAGNWTSAEEFATEATEILGDVNPTAFPRALLAVSKGRADEAQAIVDSVLAWCETSDERVAPPRFRWLLGLLELSLGKPERARDFLTSAQGLLDAAGIREPGYLPVLPDLAESLVACGQLREAKAVAARLQPSAEGVRSTWATLAALRTNAVISLGEGNTQSACAMSDDAAIGYKDAGMLFEHGRALLLAGEARRRAGQRTEAAHRLSAAMHVFAGLGAQRWLDRAEREVRRANPRPSRDQHQLTAAETHVALLVAAGRTNKEAAAALYTTVATVEAHLTRIYRKLGLRSRSELARWMAQSGAPAAPLE